MAGQFRIWTGAQNSYSKVLAVFKCSGENCQKVWTSVHGWERNEKVQCKFCNVEAKIVNVMDEMLVLDNFDCPCGYWWQSINDDMEECGDCGSMVPPNGCQQRFARRCSYKCTSKNCKQEWDTFSTTKQHTQRCGTCQCRGDIIRMQQLPPRAFSRRQPAFIGANASHRTDCCDMCQDIIAQGKGRNCMAYRNVSYKLEQSMVGDVSQKILFTK